MRYCVWALLACASVWLASACGCRKQPVPADSGAVAVRTGRPANGEPGKGTGDTKMTPPGDTEPDAAESGQEEEPTPGSVRQQMKDVLAPEFATLSRAVKSGDLGAASRPTESLLASAEALDTADGAPRERDALDAFIGYRDDLVAAADNLLDAIDSNDPAAAQAAMQDMGKACAACHKESRDPRR